MANAVAEWSETAANNMSLGAIGLDGATMPPSQIDNAFRELIAQVAVAGLGEFFVKGADIASATTTDLSTATGQFVSITGTTTITGFGTVAEGRWTIAKFTGALQLTYNASSLILPGLANITTAANDVAFLMSLGSGNWQCIAYSRAAGLPTVGPTSTTDSTVPRFNGTAGALQTSGVSINDSNVVTAASLQLTDTTDVTESTTGALLIGSTGSNNVTIDTNEIMARNNGSINNLTLNEALVVTSNGNVTVSGTLTVG